MKKLNQKSITPLTCILLILIFCIATLLICFAAIYTKSTEPPSENTAEKSFYAKLSDIYTKVAENGIKYESELDMTDAYADAFLGSFGDAYAAYMTPEETKAYNASSSGESKGIGLSVVVSEETGYICVTSVMLDSPSEEAGVRAGDKIYKVRGVEITPENAQDCLKSFSGELGESIDFSCYRGEDSYDFTVILSTIKNGSVAYEKLEDNIAYITITKFDSNTSTYFNKALEKAARDGCKSYIFDVRGNPGGNLDAIVSVLDVLLPQGPIIRYADKAGKITVTESDDAFLDAPMVVLANSRTASAGELFTAALMDYDKAEFVGMQTYGKGSMQITYTLMDGSSVKLTAGYYMPPYSDNYDGVGIIPDVVVDQDFITSDKSLDNQLRKAIEILQQ